MGRIWKAVLIAVKVLREVFDGGGFIISVGFSRENGRLRILLERSQWDSKTAEKVTAAHHPNQVGYKKKMQIEKESST